MERLFSLWLALLLLPLAVLLPVLVTTFVWKRAGDVLDAWFGVAEEREIEQQD
jgi:hypothetical protein